MSAIEESLRRALDNGDAADPDFRHSIYAASERALERMLASREMDPDQADAQRRRLAETIERVEREYGGSDFGAGEPEVPGAFVPAAPPAAAREADSVPLQPEGHERPLRRSAPDAREPQSFAPPPERASPAEETAPAWRPRESGRGIGRTGPPRTLRLLLPVLVLVLLAIGAYLFWFTPGEGSGTAVQPTNTGSLSPAGTDGSSGGGPNWIDVFAARDLQALSAPGGGRIEAIEAGGQPAVRVAGVAEGSSEILLALGPGLVGEIAGSSVRIEMRTGSPDGEVREFAVSCRFGDASICGRQRFATAMAEEAFVFDIEIPQSVQTPASLVIDPGLGEGGPDIDLYAVRMRTL